MTLPDPSAVLAGYGMSTEQASAAVRTSIAAIEAPRNPCHRCTAPATVQWRRNATDAEAEQHWDAVEAHIRSQPNLFDASNAEYVADRSDAVMKAVFGCDEHQVPDATITHDANCGGHGACQCGGEA